MDLIFNEDCLEGMNRIESKSIDMILCDLPYGVTKNSWDVPLNLDILWSHYSRVIKDNGAIVLFSQQPFTSTLVLSNPELFRYELIWKKSKSTGFLNAKKCPLREHENILIFYKKLPTYNPQLYNKDPKNIMAKKISAQSPCYGKFNNISLRGIPIELGYPRSIIEISSTQGSHPTEKPISLCEYLINTYSNKDELILDNCMGSGSTALACLKTGRKFIGFELNKKYYDISLERIKNCKESIPI
jgi:site-specific DNA-methyltransferase (adenine-specific)